MHLLRRLRFGHILHDRTGIEEAQTELARTERQVQEVKNLGTQFEELRQKATQIRERNGFEELMEGLLRQGRTQPRGHSH